MLVFLAACSNAENDISQQTLIKQMTSEHKPLLIDVRSADEYAQGHIPGAINIAHSEMQNSLAQLGSSKDIDVVLYCRSGMRAKKAQDILLQHNFTQVSHLKGDFMAWSDKALPVATGDAPGTGLTQ